jgi:hypothetical protein
MKTFFLIVVTTLFLCGCSEPEHPEVEAVKNVINSAYIEGIHNNGSIDDIKAGFHPSFEMLSNTEGELTRFSISEWIERIETNRANNPNQKRDRTDVKYLDVDITGGAASVKFELLRNGETIFTDYMYLYKFGDDWKIITKVYHRH